MFYFILLIPTSVIGLRNMNDKFGPFNIQIDKFEACEDSGTGETSFSTKITKVSRDKYVYTGDVRLGPKFDRDLKIHAELQAYGNQGYVPRTMQFTFKSCEQLYKLAKVNIQALYKTAGVTVEGCPLPVGNFTVKNFELKFINVVPVYIYGKYRMIVNFFYKDVKVGCIWTYGEAVPKNSQ